MTRPPVSTARLHTLAVLTAATLLLTGGRPADAAEKTPAAQEETGEILTLQARTRVPVEEGSERYHAVTRTLEWAPEKTAIVICDMWDDHYCPGAARRVGQMAPYMNKVVKAARQRGVLIIHCPSGCMDYYKDTPQRKLAQQAPKVETDVPLQGWCHLDPDREGKLPIDDSDGGCDTPDHPEPHRVYTRQHKAIEIEKGDAITDSAEAFYLMKQRGITNVIVMGVHTNMCVLGRPFSIRQMVYQGQNVVLMRDMTDAMYNPRQPPYVNHFTGVDLVVGHIEKHWCPTITSTAFLEGKPFRFPADQRPHLAIVMAEKEYNTDETLPPFALKHLGKDFKLSYVYADDEDRNNLPGIQVVEDADVLLLSVRRRVLPKEQLRVIREFIESGKPVIGLRTASHAFVLRGKEPPAGHADWPGFDHDVVGGNYHGHHGGGPKVAVEKAAAHPILTGVDLRQLPGHGSLYKVRPLRKSARPLLIGSIPGKPSEPVAWTNKNKYGGRVFYTSFGHPGDFENAQFRRLLTNGIYWAAGLSVPEHDTAGPPPEAKTAQADGC